MDQNHNSETAPLSDAAVKFNSVLTFAQGFALVAIAVAALVGICSSIWSMVELEKASLGDLLLLFLYIEILSMVKGSAPYTLVKVRFFHSRSWARWSRNSSG